MEYFKAFGFLEKTGVDLPGEASGLFWDENDFSVANLISASFGQTFRVTPMEQVRAIAAIVNGGYLLKPYVVSQVLDSDGSVVKTNERTVLRQVISEETSKTMRKMMEYVVTDGTAGSAKTPGYRVGGKTGTSEKIDVFDENGNPVEDKIVSFIGVAPIDDPKYVVLVALDTPNYVAGTSYTPHNQYISGGLMAAPTVRDVFLDILPYLGVEPDYSSDDIRGVNITLPDVIGMTQDEAAKAAFRQVHYLPHRRCRAIPLPTSFRARARRFPAIPRSSSTSETPSRRPNRSRFRTSWATALQTWTIWRRTPDFTFRPRAPITATNTSRSHIRTLSPEQWLTEGLQLR